MNGPGLALSLLIFVSANAEAVNKIADNSLVRCYGRDDSAREITVSFTVSTTDNQYGVFAYNIGVPGQGWLKTQSYSDKLPARFENSKLTFTKDDVSLETNLAANQITQCAESKVIRNGNAYPVWCVINQSFIPLSKKQEAPEAVR
jgi:hypothetical protein